MDTLDYNHSANNSYNTSAMLTFENIWVHSTRPTIVEPIESRVAVNTDNQGMSRKNVTHSTISIPFTRYQKHYQKCYIKWFEYNTNPNI